MVAKHVSVRQNHLLDRIQLSIVKQKHVGAGVLEVNGKTQVDRLTVSNSVHSFEVISVNIVQQRVVGVDIVHNTKPCEKIRNVRKNVEMKKYSGGWFSSVSRHTSDLNEAPKISFSEPLRISSSWLKVEDGPSSSWSKVPSFWMNGVSLPGATSASLVLFQLFSDFFVGNQSLGADLDEVLWRHVHLHKVWVLASVWQLKVFGSHQKRLENFLRRAHQVNQLTPGVDHGSSLSGVEVRVPDWPCSAGVAGGCSRKSRRVHRALVGSFHQHPHAVVELLQRHGQVLVVGLKKLELVRSRHICASNSRQLVALRDRSFDQQTDELQLLDLEVDLVDNVLQQLASLDVVLHQVQTTGDHGQSSREYVNAISFSLKERQIEASFLDSRVLASNGYKAVTNSADASSSSFSKIDSDSVLSWWICLADSEAVTSELIDVSVFFG
ncbi:hypothetical protein OGAPHI_006577 [Ogataea philodendri]|uniref:Uncharacterized protein n=1 Tax=Ogataea philodendri TaxID=1378263 RepID=A0A9P8NWR9_9ASCO|nr:uncharacterized protein OGAPHI_006577 [Ogataea philodendri]KAH3661170.1 hypothetical protein OGAPHI_006577 [Ogataea philodendri]